MNTDLQGSQDIGAAIDTAMRGTTSADNSVARENTVARDTGSNDVARDVGTEAAVAKWEAPGYMKPWKEEARKAFEYFASNPANKAYVDPILGQLEETNKFIGQRDQQLRRYSQYDPVLRTLQPYENVYRLQGMTLEQGVSQLVAGAEYLRSNPDDAFPYFAQTYRPKDPARAIQALAQAWGADLGQVSASAPYIDPAVQTMVRPLVQEINSLKQQLGGFTQQHTQQQQTALLQEVEAFEQAKDASGNPKHPHLQAVFPDMLRLIKAGYDESLESLYERAIYVNPEARKQVEQGRQKAAEAQALQEAARKTAEAEQASKASRNVSGKGTVARERSASDIDDAITKAMKTHRVAS